LQEKIAIAWLLARHLRVSQKMRSSSLALFTASGADIQASTGL
jgi:hypothetical protein